MLEWLLRIYDWIDTHNFNWDPVPEIRIDAQGHMSVTHDLLYHLSSPRAVSYGARHAGASLHRTEFMEEGIASRRVLGPKEIDRTSVWTGCGLKLDGFLGLHRDLLYFTSSDKKEDAWEQHIDVAEIEEDGTPGSIHRRAISARGKVYGPTDRLYGPNGRGERVIGAMRDPAPRPDNGRLGMLFAGNDAKVQDFYNACIGYALSDDGLRFKNQEPFFSPARSSSRLKYLQMELPHTIQVRADQSTSELLFFSAYPEFVYDAKHTRPLDSPFNLYAYKVTQDGMVPVMGITDAGIPPGNIPAPSDIYGARVFHVEGNDIYMVGFYDDIHARKGEVSEPFILRYDPGANTLKYLGKLQQQYDRAGSRSKALQEGQ